MIDHPLKWLILELPKYIGAAELSRLLTGLEAQKKAYNLQTKINQAERMIRTLERRIALEKAPSDRDVRKLDNWRYKLKRLQAQQ